MTGCWGEEGVGALDREEPRLSGAARWHVLHTKPRQEKAVARFLVATDVGFYLPLVPRVNFIRGRKFVSQVPLFPGYVFLAGELSDAYAAVSTKRVCHVLDVPDQDGFVREIGQIRRALSGRGEIELYPHAAIGMLCRVRRGPFMGFEGVVADRLGPGRLVLQVAILGQGAALEIDADLLEPLN